MNKEKINVCLVITVYSFFLYLLLNGYNKKDIFIFTDLFPKEVSKNVKHIQIPQIYFTDGAKMAPLNSIRGIIDNIVGYSKYFYAYIKLRILLFIKTYNKEVTVYGHAHIPLAYIFYENENSNIIEDGLSNYTIDISETHKINPIIDKILHIFGIYFLKNTEGFGSHKNIKNVYLTKKHDHPLIKDKVKIIDMKDSWKNLTENEKNEILSIFNINQEMFNFEGKTLLILTQPLSQENHMTLEKELNIYREMISKFKDHQIIIKPHPRDDKNYEKIFPNAIIIEKTFPIEILTVIGVKPTVVGSIISNSLLNFEESEKYIYEGNLENERLNNLRDDLIRLINNK